MNNPTVTTRPVVLERVLARDVADGYLACVAMPAVPAAVPAVPAVPA